MALYEHLLIARQDISAQAVDALATHLKTIVEGEGGKVEKQEYWGGPIIAYSQYSWRLFVASAKTGHFDPEGL